VRVLLEALLRNCDGRRVLEDALTRAAMHTGTWEGHEAGLLIGAMLETKFPEAG